MTIQAKRIAEFLMGVSIEDLHGYEAVMVGQQLGFAADLIERQAAEIAALVHDIEKYVDRDTRRLAELASLHAATAPPREPTQGMVDAGYGVEFTDPDAFYHMVWRAMYDAARVAASAPAPMSDDARRNRATDLPGGMECEQCGCIFIGGAQHALCGICADAVRAGRASKTSNPVE